MHAISSDNDNQDNNYTKAVSSITVTYHLNYQALRENVGWGRGAGRILDRDFLFRISVRVDPVYPLYKHGVTGVVELLNATCSPKDTGDKVYLNNDDVVL